MIASTKLLFTGVRYRLNASTFRCNGDSGSPEHSYCDSVLTMYLSDNDLHQFCSYASYYKFPAFSTWTARKLDLLLNVMVATTVDLDFDGRIEDMYIS